MVWRELSVCQAKVAALDIELPVTRTCVDGGGEAKGAESPGGSTGVGGAGKQQK